MSEQRISDPGLTEAEFMRRLRARLVRRAGPGADAVADAVSYSEWADGFENDPEGAADEEMSYWTTDIGFPACPTI